MKTIFKISINVIIFLITYYYNQDFLQSLLTFVGYFGANSLININIGNNNSNNNINVSNGATQTGHNNIISGKH